MVGYSPWGRDESDMTERLHFHIHFIKIVATRPVVNGGRKIFRQLRTLLSLEHEMSIG